MNSLRQNLIKYIKTHGQVHFRDIEKYAEENGYKAYTAARRLQEARNPKDPYYDPHLKTVEENGTIKFYVYDFVGNVYGEIKPPETIQHTTQPETPRRIENTVSQPTTTSHGNYAYYKPEPTACCPIWKASKLYHAGNCETQKQIHS